VVQYNNQTQGLTAITMVIQISVLLLEVVVLFLEPLMEELNWQYQTSGTNYYLDGVSFSDTNNGSTVGWTWAGQDKNGIILRTTNGGSSWTKQLLFPGYGLLCVCFTDKYHGWAGGNNNILETTNGGLNWSGLPYNLDATIEGICFTDSVNGIATGAFVTMRTTDGGTWIEVPDYIQLLCSVFHLEIKIMGQPSVKIPQFTDHPIEGKPGSSNQAVLQIHCHCIVFHLPIQLTAQLLEKMG